MLAVKKAKVVDFTEIGKVSKGDSAWKLISSKLLWAHTSILFEKIREIRRINKTEFEGNFFNG